MLSLPLAARCGPLALEALACVALGFGLALPGLALHAVATAAAVLLSVQRTRPDDQRGAALATAAIVFALPLVGAAIVALVAWPTWARRSAAAPAGTIEIALPSVSEDGDEAQAPPAEQRPIREVLSDSPGAARVDAVMALRSMDARRAVPLLKLAFNHPSEDVRLLAFAILDRREKRLRAGIRALERRLAQLDSRSSPLAEHDRSRARCQRRLAHHYWELCYGRFVSGDLEIEALERAARYAAAAESVEADAATALLLARIHLRQRKAAEAWQYLERAERAGAHRGSSVPLFAEAAYALRRFEEIPRLLGRMQGSELRRPDLAEVAQFWTEPRPS